ncbi:MAG: polysaccharide deacetylase family protein [Salegentibacter mishustinae]|nr:polysaccharide deacetylase family protein [Salegentibacter mishustinae]
MRKNLYRTLGFLAPFSKLFLSDRIRVLAYHKVPDSNTFEKQIAYLHSNYNIICVEDLLNYFEAKIQLPKNPLLITFDDGDISVFENGLPVLRKHDLPSCLFIITKLIDSTEDVWIKRVEAQEMKNGKSYEEARRIVKRLKTISNAERLKEMQKYSSVKKKQLTIENLQEMQENKMFVANHTHTHPMLDKCTSQEIKEELQNSKKVFEELNLQGFNIFAYPNGNASEKTAAILNEWGMKLVFLFDHKINKSNPNPLNISRIMVDTDTEINEFKAKVSGVHPVLFNLQNSSN